MAKKRTLTEEQFQLVVTALSQADYAFFHGDGDCAEAAVRHLAMALKALGQKTAAEEADEEDDDNEEDSE